MHRLLKILIYALTPLFVLNIINGQNKFYLELGLGINSCSFLLNDVKLAEDQTFSIERKVGPDFKLGIKYKLTKLIEFKSNINFNLTKFVYKFDDLRTDNDFLVDSSEWKVRIDNSANDIGITIGFEFIIHKKISTSFVGSYQKGFNKIQKYSRTNIVHSPDYVEEKTFKTNIKDIFAIGFEASYYLNQKFYLTLGYDYYIKKEFFFPDSINGNKYRYYFLIQYIFK
ncbi:MAG: hypothetical protein IPH57_07950 [Saprospiraceae bacterium]|nr:hypothetical protein [Saprospiraceae bacterium]